MTLTERHIQNLLWNRLRAGGQEWMCPNQPLMPYLYTMPIPKTHNGYCRDQMPGNDDMARALTFFLFRNGKIALELDEHGKLREVTSKIIRMKHYRERKARL